MFNTRDVADYYNTTQNHYERWWNLHKSRALHYGIWEPDTRSFQEALENTNKVLLNLADIKNSDSVLDAGCGVGGAAVYIHKYTGAKVTGVTLSQRQLDTANYFSQTEGVNDKVNFQLMDFTETTFPDQSFDVIWACESVCHVPDPTKFINEAFRLLKSGGRLVLFDFFRNNDNKIDKKEWLRKWCDTWAVSGLTSILNFKQELNKTGFDNTKVIDFTPKIRKSAKRMYYAALMGVLPSELYKLANPNVSKFARNHYKCGIYQYKALRADLWQYCAVLSQKG